MRAREPVTHVDSLVDCQVGRQSRFIDKPVDSPRAREKGINKFSCPPNRLYMEGCDILDG